jgi:hypothetical protein
MSENAEKLKNWPPLTVGESTSRGMERLVSQKK